MGNRAREIYCRLVCLFLWLNVIRLLSGLAFEKSIFTLDFYYMGQTKTTFLIPAVCLAIQVAAVSTIFIRNNEETNWLVPFYSSKDYLIRSRSNFRPRMEDYARRVNISVAAALILAFLSSISLSAYLIHCAWQSEAFRSLYVSNSSQSQIQTAIGSVTLERFALLLVMVNDILWAIYSTFICFIVSFYFNLICSIMRSRFHSISKIIEDLAESNTRKTTNQARKITTLYLEHNEVCELLDESNDFWQYLILFTYFTYIPAYCYCLYNLFFVDFAPWPSFITWVIHTHMGFIILLLSFSAAGVSTEVSERGDPSELGIISLDRIVCSTQHRQVNCSISGSEASGLAFEAPFDLPTLAATLIRLNLFALHPNGPSSWLFGAGGGMRSMRRREKRYRITYKSANQLAAYHVKPIWSSHRLYSS